MTYPCHKIALLFLAWSALWPTPAWAEAWPVPRGPSREPLPYTYDSAAWKQVPRAFLDDYSACILYYGTSYLIEPDGTVETIVHEITRLGGRKGIDNLGEYRQITFDPSWQTLVLNEARIHKADGRIVPIEPRHVHLRDVSTDYQVYDRDKQLIISFPNLEVGDCYEVKWTTRGRSAETGGRFFSRVTFGDAQYPVVRDEVRVKLPKTMPLHHAVINGQLEHISQKTDSHTFWQWWSTKRKPLPGDSDRPSRETLRLQVMLSTFASWADVGRWKEKVRRDCWQCTSDIRQLVQKLTGGLTTPLEKAQALTYWVRRSIRYVSISSTGHGYTPRRPDQVFASRYGDCKDQAQLLAVMLQEAGLDVSLVTLGALDDGQVVPTVPSPWGTHGILLVNIAGKDHWIDTTASLAGWNFLPRSDRDRLVYVTQGAKLRLMKTPGLTPADNRMVQFTELHIQPDGTSKAQRAMSYFGLAAVGRREAWLEVPEGERRRLVTADLQDAHSRSRLLDFRVDDQELGRPHEPVTARMNYDIVGHFGGDLNCREASLTDSSIWNRLLAYNLDPDRAVPLHLWAPFESVHRYIVHLPLCYRFDGLPRNQEVKSKWGAFEVRVVHDNNNPRRLEVTFHTRLEQVLVEPLDFAAFQKFHDELSRRWRVWLTLKPTTDLADASALTWQACHWGTDLPSLTILAKLYLQHDQCEAARAILKLARFWHPHDAALWELAIKCAPDLAEEEGIYREMVRRFPKETKYVLALAETQIKRGHHGPASKNLAGLTASESAFTKATAHLHLARSALAQQQAKAALQHLQAAGAADGDVGQSAAALILHAQAHSHLDQTIPAIAAYRAALQKDADAGDVLPALIKLELAAGQTAQALDSLRRLAVKAEGNRQGLLQAADFYVRLGRLDEAFDLAQRARDLGFNSQVQRLLGLIHYYKDEYAQAVFHLERADAGPGVVTALIRSYLAQGKLSEAQRHAEAVRTFSGTSLDLGRAETQVVHLGHRRAEILAQFSVPWKNRASLLRAVEAFVCAEHLFLAGRPLEEVDRLLQASLAEGVPLGPAHALRGLLALDQGRLGQALRDAERAISFSPNLAAGHYVRGRVRLERGDVGAVGDLHRAADLSSHKDGLILHFLAAAQRHIGQHDLAVQTQHLAAILRPRDPQVQQQLQELIKKP